MTPDSPHAASLDLALALLAAHLLGDFVLQTARMVKDKGRPGVLLLHAGVVAALSYLLAGRWSSWLIPVAVLVSHAAIDYLKVVLGRGGSVAFVLDQLAHVAVLAVLVLLAEPSGPLSAWAQLYGNPWWAFLVIVSGLILVVRVGGMLVGLWVQRYLDEIQRYAVSAGPQLKPTRGLTNGGRLIGQWERALIFLFVALGQPASVGFLVAAKSIFRFGELKERENRMEAEYITIGTFMSFGWALAWSYPTWWLVRSLLV